MIDIEVERARLEAQWEAKGWTRVSFRLYGGRYVNPLIESAFNGWLAAKRDSAEREAKS